MTNRIGTFLKNKYEYLFAALFAFAFFVALYGVKVLDVTYTDFLVGGYEIKEATFGGMDSAQHYYGWAAYRQADWRFPIGCFDNFSYPNTNCIIFTDSIPLLAIFFKLFSFMLPTSFQYFGIWGLLAMVLNGLVAIKVLKHFTDDKLSLIGGAILFITLPIFIWRMYIHIALDSQWLILLALEPIVAFGKMDASKARKRYLIIASLASLIHIYLFYFCGIILAGYCLCQLLSYKDIKGTITLILGYILVALAIIGLVGGFSVPNTGEAIGLDSCSMNLNSFFNSEGYSLFFKELDQYTGQEFFKTMQFEGYAYLGLGIFVLMLSTAIMLLCRYIKLNKAKNGVYISLGVLCLLSFALALSPSVTLGRKLLFRLPIPDFVYKLWSIFRSTGRTIWIAVYILVLVGLILITKLKKRIRLVLISLIILLQLVDNYPLYDAVHRFFYSDIAPVYSSEYILQTKDFWDRVGDNEQIEHVVIGITASPYNDETWTSINDTFYIGVYPQTLQLTQLIMGDFAVDHQMTLNYFLFARSRYDIGRQYIFDIIEEGKSLDKYLFIFFEENKMQALMAGLNVYYVDGYYIGYSGDLGDEYLLANEDICYATNFADASSGDQFVLEANTAVFYSCVELAKGNYMLCVSGSDSDALMPIVSSAYKGCVYDCQYIGSDEDGAYYQLYIRESDSSVCFSLKNISNENVGLNYAIIIPQ